MAKFDKPDKILKPGEASPGTSLQSTGDDWLSRVNLTVDNLKELASLWMKLRGSQEGKTNPAGISSNPPANSPGLADYIQLLIRAGYGDVPIGKLIEQISPYTLKQFMELARNAGLKQ